MSERRDRQSHSNFPHPLGITGPPTGEECASFSEFWFPLAPVTATIAGLLAGQENKNLWSKENKSK